MSALLTECLFRDNQAVFGGGIYGDLTTLKRCRFTGNVAYDRGGALDVRGGLDCESCLFDGNQALDEVAAVRSHGELRFTHCTFAGNRSPDHRVFLPYGRSLAVDLAFTNCIVWGGDAGLAPERIWPANARVTYSNVQGGWLGEGNIDADPCFADPGFWDSQGTPDDSTDDIWIAGDYHLKSQAGRWDPISESWVQDEVTSPCIDAGDPNAPIGDEPFPNGAIVNIGAYGGTTEASKSYFGEPLCEMNLAGDINGDCRVDIEDLLTVLSQWRPAGPVVEQGPRITFVEPTDGAILKVVSGPITITAEISDAETIANVVFHISHTTGPFSYRGRCEGQQEGNRWSGQWHWKGDTDQLLSGEHVVVISAPAVEAERSPVWWEWSSYSYTLPDGEYVITAEVTDDGGRTTVSPEVRVTILRTRRSRGR